MYEKKKGHPSRLFHTYFIVSTELFQTPSSNDIYRRKPRKDTQNGSEKASRKTSQKVSQKTSQKDILRES